jgi:tRNA G18 (ribose-2'-O)-methylase SpoU
MFGTIGSLNVSVACGFFYTKQLTKLNNDYTLDNKRIKAMALVRFFLY